MTNETDEQQPASIEHDSTAPRPRVLINLARGTRDMAPTERPEPDDGDAFSHEPPRRTLAEVEASARERGTLPAEAPEQKHRRTRDAMATTALDPREVVGDARWHVALAALERIDPMLVYALRLGVIAFMAELARAMALPDAKPDLVARMRELTEWLARIPFER